jgi:DHA1 family bicyclomycin/chloramphenicol resistance-like MFS transporter
MNEKNPSLAFAISLGSITLIGPLAIHLFLPAMPSVKASFGASDALVQLTFSVTLMTMAVVTPVYGTLSDRYGRRPILLSGLAFFLLGSIVSAVAPSVTVLIIGRLIQAMGAGCGLTLTRAIARDAYGPAVLVKAIAYLTMAYTLGPMIAPPLGGILIDSFGWRSAFWFALAAGMDAPFFAAESAANQSIDAITESPATGYPALALVTIPLTDIGRLVNTGC